MGREEGRRARLALDMDSKVKTWCMNGWLGRWVNTGAHACGPCAWGGLPFWGAGT